VRVGSLEIQIMAGIARLQKDMNDAQRIVGSSMGQVERSVASANRAMQVLGVGIPVAMITDQIRRMSDQYTKLDAQLRLATKSQAQYMQGMSDIRRISTIAQSDISATSMLYTRLMNVMDGTGVSQAKLATVTETVTFGLKAYGATSAEAASAALQLSQAMGANRLGGEEFRAVMEAMPNVMKVLANSMGVPLGELRALSIAGKITAEEMVKAFGDPAIAEQFKQLALKAQTITGAWTVARNEMMLLVGEFMKSSGATSGIIAGFNAMGVVLRFLVDNIQAIIVAVQTYAAILAGKFLYSLIDAKLAQIALNAAHAEALAMNVAMAQAEVRRLAVNLEVIASERAKATAQLQSAQATMAATSAVGAHSAALRYNAIATAQAAAATANLAALGRAQAATTASQIAATEALSAAQLTSTTSFKSKIGSLVGRAGIWGMIMFGIYEVADAMGWIDKLFDNAETRTAKFANKQRENLDKAIADMEKMLQAKNANPSGIFGAAWEVSTGGSQGEMEQQLAMLKKMRSEQLAGYEAAVAADNAKRAGVSLSHDEEVMQARMIELAEQYNAAKLTQAEYLQRVNEALYGKAKAGKAALTVAELQAKNDAEVLNASAEYWKKIDEKRLEDEQKAEQDALAKRQKEHQGFWDSIDKTAHDTFVSIANGSKDAATRLRDTFKNIFFDWLYQMTIKKWIVGVSASFAPGMASAAGGAGGMAQSAGLITSTGNLSTGAIVGLGAIAAIAGVAALAKYGFGWGNSAERVGEQRLEGSFTRGGFSGGMAQDWKRDGGWFTSGSSWTERTALTTAQHKAFKATVDGLQSTFNTLGSAIGDTGIKTRDWTVKVNQAGDVTGVLADGIGSQLVPALTSLRMEGETLANTAVRLTSVFKSTGDFIAALGMSSMQAFGAEGVMSAAQRQALVTATGGDQSFAQSVGTFMSAILTPAEQLQMSLNTVGRTFAQLNIVGVETNAQFAELVRQALTAGDYSTVGALLSVSDAFASITKSAATATDALLALVKASSFSTFADYQRMMASVTASAGQPTGGSSAITSATAAAGGTLAQEQIANDKANKKAAALAEMQKSAAQAGVWLANNPYWSSYGNTYGGLYPDKVAAYRTAQSYYNSLPAFASGGVHSGGMRLVGENGPEIEYTGPSTITSNSDSRKMFDNSGVIASVDALRAELRAVGIAVSGSTQKTAKILDRWDGQGMPEVREAA